MIAKLFTKIKISLKDERRQLKISKKWSPRLQIDPVFDENWFRFSDSLKYQNLTV